jgi:hypothetical protein
MRFRKLRIAWSVGCAIACVLLIVLWVRSYSWVDTVYVNIGVKAFKIESAKGSLILIHNPNGPWGISSQTLDEWSSRRESLQMFMRSMYQKKNAPSPVATFATLPHWFPVLLSAVFAAVPWIRWSTRFTLRTLLIATTLVAMVLGLVVWAANK